MRRLVNDLGRLRECSRLHCATIVCAPRRRRRRRAGCASSWDLRGQEDRHGFRTRAFRWPWRKHSFLIPGSPGWCGSGRCGSVACWLRPGSGPKIITCSSRSCGRVVGWRNVIRSSSRFLQPCTHLVQERVEELCVLHSSFFSSRRAVEVHLSVTRTLR